MKIISEGNDLVITEAFSGVMFRADSGQELAVCVRDEGFEIHYTGEALRIEDKGRCMRPSPGR